MRTTSNCWLLLIIINEFQAYSAAEKDHHVNLLSISETTALSELTIFGTKINATCNKDPSFKNCNPKQCSILTLGHGMSTRTLCNIQPEKPCYMLSYGVGPNYSYSGPCL